jgi:2-polyprenyl-3-methyl-5-hydroxy-6-metoxy-1,4-benzoquinol methylase
MSGERDFINCNVCGVRNEHELSDRDRDGCYLRTVICKKCGLVYTNPRPGSSEIEQYYKHSYRLDYKGVRQPKRKHVLRAAKIAAKRISEIQGYLFSGMRALDIGSGGGEIVYAMRLMGINSDGLEPNEGYADYAREVLNLPIQSGRIENVILPQNSYDIITMFHVIEHLSDPLRAMQTIFSSLKPDGILVVECPNIEAHCQSPSHRLHRAHLFNFNTSTLRALAARAGFRTVKISLSSDGGNITAIFRKSFSAPAMPDMTYNYQQVMKSWHSHTAIKYYLSRHPYKRLVAKGFRIVKEATKTFLMREREMLLRKGIEKCLFPSYTANQK